MSEAWYYAKDGKPTGPVPRQDIQNLIQRGEITPQTLVWREGSPDWIPASSAFPGSDNPSSPTPTPPTPPTTGLLDVEECLREAWSIFSRHWGVLMVGWLIACLILPLLVSSPFTIVEIVLIGAGAASGQEFATARSILNLMSTLVSLATSPPLQAGMFLLSLQAMRGMPNLAVIFEPFKTCWLRVVIAALVVMIGTALAIAPPVALAVYAFMQKIWPLVAVGAALAIALGIFLSICWLFVLPLVADARLHPLDAVRTSMRLVLRSFFPCFALSVMLFLINLAGLLCCVVGLLATGPYSTVALMVAYRRLYYTQNGS